MEYSTPRPARIAPAGEHGVSADLMYAMYYPPSDACSAACAHDCTVDHGACGVDTTICYDPHCSMPPCESHSLQSALTYGVMPCAHPEPPRCPPVPAAYAGPCLADCTVPCLVDVPCADGCVSACTQPHVDPAKECISVCDGYVGAHGMCASPPDLGAWCPSLNVLPAHDCCAVPCREEASCVGTMCAPPLPVRSGAATPKSEPRSDSLSTGGHTTPCTPLHFDDVERVPTVFSCEWDECNAHLSTLEALAAHVQQTHTMQAKHWEAVMQGSHSPWATDCTTPSEEAPYIAGDAHLESLLHLEPACLCPAPLPGKKKHGCGWEHCTESFDTHAELTEHIATVHVGSGKNQYECRWVGCARVAEGRTFSQRQKVLRHIKTHTGDRPYACPVCEKRFTEATTLTQHMRTHTNERPYKCDFPGCNKTFSVAGSLTIHRRTHTGDRPFVCPVPGCGKQFAESSNLNKHMRVHRGERPFACPECKRTFARLDQVTRHRKTHLRPHSEIDRGASTPLHVE